MSKTEIREPKQKRSIEKKNKIIDAAFVLICEKGYYNTNTAEIAKVAGVSTGIVYNYFSDKKEIFLEAIKKNSILIEEKILTSVQALADVNSLEQGINLVLNYLVNAHSIKKRAHEEIETMVHTDEDVAKFLVQFENDLCHKIADKLINLGINPLNIHEKVHLIYNIAEDFCHETIYHKHPCLNFNIMRELTITSIKNILLQ